MKWWQIHIGGYYKGPCGVIRQVVDIEGFPCLDDSLECKRPLQWKLISYKNWKKARRPQGSGSCSWIRFASWARSEVKNLSITGICPTCWRKVSYNGYYDAEFCLSCDKWLSEKCGATDPHDCGFDCKSRPDKPSMCPPDKR